MDQSVSKLLAIVDKKYMDPGTEGERGKEQKDAGESQESLESYEGV